MSPEQSGRHFVDDDFLNDFFFILMQILMKFIPKGVIESKSA